MCGFTWKCEKFPTAFSTGIILEGLSKLKENHTRLVLPSGRFRLEFLHKILHPFLISLMSSVNPIQTNTPIKSFFSGQLT